VLSSGLPLQRSSLNDRDTQLAKWMNHEATLKSDGIIAGNTSAFGRFQWSCRPEAKLSHKYKFVYIMITKTGSSTVELGVLARLLCPLKLGETEHTNRLGSKVGSACTEGVPWDEWPEDEEQIARIWRDYFVFALARNVWMRAASAYSFLSATYRTDHGSLLSASPVLRAGTLAWPSWIEFCRDPSVLARRAFCIGRCSGWQGLLEHVAPQAPCLADRQGRPVVDFLADTQHLDEDLRIILSEIVRRVRASSSADTEHAQSVLHEVELHGVPKANAELSAGYRHDVRDRLEALFGSAQQLGCAEALSEAYAEDVLFLHSTT